MEISKRMYANIRLPVNVYKNGEFKMLYDQMQIEMNDYEQEIKINLETEKIEEMKEEIQEIMEEKTEELELEERIYKTDINKQKKKRWNTTFRKKMGGNQLTRRMYETIASVSNLNNLPVVSYLHALDSEQS